MSIHLVLLSQRGLVGRERMMIKTSVAEEKRREVAYKVNLDFCI